MGKLVGVLLICCAWTAVFYLLACLLARCASKKWLAERSKMIEAAIFSLLSNDAGVAALVGSRIYPDFLPQDETLPALVYFLKKTGFNYIFNSEAPNNVDTPFSVDCWASTAAGASALVIAVKAVLQHQAVTVDDRTILASTLTNEQQDYDDQTKAFKFSLFFNLFNEAYVAPSVTPFYDSCTDANGTLITSHTSDSGHSWALLNGTGARIYDPGVLKLYAATIAGVDDDFGSDLNGVLSFTLIPPSGIFTARAYLRWLDSNNHYRIEVTDYGRLWVYRVVDGVLTQLAYENVHDPYAAGGETLQITINGADITVIRQEGQPDEAIYGPYTDPSPWEGGSRIAFYGIGAFSVPNYAVSLDEIFYAPSA